MAHPLVVNVTELLRVPGAAREVTASVPAEEFSFDDPRVGGADVEVSVRLEALVNGIAVHGTARAGWQGECRRCLDPVAGVLCAEIDEICQRVPTVPEAHPVADNHIDLQPMVRENVLLALPAGPLCRDDCPGFCAQCGADLRVGACGCATSARDERWAALDALRDRLPGPPG